MFLTVHSAIGLTAVTALGIHNPAAAFAVGLVLHYLGDAVPHGDEPIGEWVKNGRSPVLRAAPVFAGDFLLMSAMFALVSATGGLQWHLVVAIAGSILPDVLFGIETIFKRRLFGFLSDLHDRAHAAIGIRLPLHYGLPFQAVLAFMLWYGFPA